MGRIMSSLGLAWTVASSRVATVIGALARSVSPQRLGATAKGLLFAVTAIIDGTLATSAVASTGAGLLRGVPRRLRFGRPRSRGFTKRAKDGDELRRIEKVYFTIAGARIPVEVNGFWSAFKETDFKILDDVVSFCW